MDRPYAMWATDRFLDRLKHLSHDGQRQVIDKSWEVLRRDPRDDGDAKKFLQGSRRRVKCYRLRSGKYRVVYTYDPVARWVTLHDVDDRGDIYVGGPNVSGGRGEREAPPPSDGLPGALPAPEPATAAAEWAERPAPPSATPLPRPIDEAMIERLGVPPEFADALRRCRTEDDLVSLALPPDLHERIIDEVYTDEPLVLPGVRRWRLDSPETLLGWLSQDLTTLLLDLDPEQEKHVAWSPTSRGPTLLKGGPGSGKSVVAAYRARNLVLGLRDQGVPRPRVLVTTYTNALAASLRHLIDRLLGPDARCVEVRTADQVVRDVLALAGKPYKPKDDGVARAACYFARERMRNGDEADRDRAARLDRFGIDYLREEIERVIVGRDLRSLDDYRAASRAGRRVGFNGPVREAVWRLHELVEDWLSRQGATTFAQTRREALRLLRLGHGSGRYDGVIIDEAQDLDPNLLAIAAALCPAPDRLFVTADGDQSIYGGSFRWSEASRILNFQGRTGRLETCYRCTAEIAAAARTWLADAGIEPPGDPVAFPRHGARPVACAARDVNEALALAARFLRAAMVELRIGAGSCAVLTATNADASWIAGALVRLGLPATYTPSTRFDLGAPGVKVATFHAAKGLEFPVVALVDRPLPPVAGRTDDERAERQEAADRERRTRYVAMTRAMHALAVIRADPAGLPDGEFDPACWRTGDDDDWGGWLPGGEDAAG